MQKPDTVRIATAADEEKIFWHLMSDLNADNNLDLPVSEKAVYETVHACCTGDVSIAGIIDGRDGPVASIGIRGVYPWFSSQIMLSQIWLFVIPAARGGARLAEDLFHFADWHRGDMSERLGYNVVLENSVMSLRRLAAKKRLWRRYGQEIGAVYWTRGADGQDEHKVTDNNPGQSGGQRRLQRPHSERPERR